MVSQIIDHLVAETVTPVLFFYFRHGNQAKTSFEGLLRALLVQMLYLDDSLTELFHQKFAPLGKSELSALANLQNVLLDTLQSQRDCFVILDGLDECGQESRTSKPTSEQIIDWFIDKVLPACQVEGGTVRLLLSGQRDGVLDKRLSTYPSIGLDLTAFHKKDIQRFSEQRAREIGKRFAISKESEISIAMKVTNRSDGKRPHQCLVQVIY